MAIEKPTRRRKDQREPIKRKANRPSVLKKIAALSVLISHEEARAIPRDLAADLHKYANGSKRT